MYYIFTLFTYVKLMHFVLLDSRPNSVVKLVLSQTV